MASGGGPSGGGMGRGGRLLAALKEKKREETTSVSPPTIRSRLESTPGEQEAAPPPTALPPQPAAPAIEKPTPLVKGLGRGIISSLLSKPPTAAVKPPPVLEPGAFVVTQTTEAKPAPIKRISPMEELPTPTTPAPVTKPAEPQPEPAGLKIMPRGRGMLVSRAAVAKPAEERPPPAVVEEVRSRLETMRVEEPAAQPQVVQPSTSQKVSLAKPEQKSDSGSGAKKSSTSAETKSAQTQFMSLVTTTASSKSVEKAMEEIKVEHIQRISPVRKMGQSGEPTPFMTNYIKLKCKNMGVYQYVVQYDPPVDSVYNRHKLLYMCNEVIGSVRLFDGLTLFLPILLKDKVTSLEVKRKVGDEEVKHVLRIQLTKILPPEQIPPTVFNIIFKGIMKELKMTRIGQHYFSPLRQIDVTNQHLQIWPGYVTAVHEFEDGLYLVMDVAHKVLRSQTCLELMMNLYQKYGNSPDFRNEVTKALCGNIVLTKYNNRTYRIDDIMWDQDPSATFHYHDGQTISYHEYYKKHYDIEITDMRQPLLLSRAKAKKQNTLPQAAPQAGQQSPQANIICLVPELCYMTGLSDDMRSDNMLKKDLATHTRLTPIQRYEQLKNLVDSIRKTPNALKLITNWGLELDEGINEMTGRVVPTEKIMFGRKEFDVDFKCDWTRPATNEEVLRAVEIKHWLCVYPANKESIVARFADLAHESARRIGIRIEGPDTVALKDDKPDTYYHEIKKHLNENTQIVVIILPMISDNRYMRVKKLCCIECPVPSQVIVAKTINKPDNALRSVAQKIVLQMNVKLGGELWRLPIPIKKLMVVGIDVYHKIEKGYKSIAGFVSSLNNDQTRWYSKVCFQMVGQELADTLKTAFAASLKKYAEVNNFLPDKIFVFRDGVSEGQLPIVSEHEVAQLRSCFTADYNPQLCVIVVQKRINTRIFAGSFRQMTNPKPGSIIDHGITSKEMFDFFLVSQHVNQGTVTPTHYIVPYDDTGLKPDHVQRMAYKMTYLYYNWCGTIRVPAPCQYAHKLAFLTGQYLQEEAHEDLCNRLFYL